jgi:type IV fimbrial biogenesis protein FimT
MKKYNDSNKNLNRQKGMTFIELMIVTVILAVLASTGVPALQSLFERRNVFAIGDFFVKTMKLARLEAIQRGEDITVVSTTGTDDWSQGWTIQYTDDDDEIQIISTYPSLRNGPVFTSSEFNDSVGVTIRPTGQVVSPGSFELFYVGCEGEQILNYEVFVSGILQKGVSVCP